jgi:hypothetical protein
MKKLFLLTILLACALYAQVNNTNNIVQPCSHIDGTAITAGLVAGVYTVSTSRTTDQLSVINWGKAIALKYGAADGYACIHLLGDAASSWYYVYLVNGDWPQGLLFDKVRQAGSTVTLDSLTIFKTCN